jgi:D-threonate/D-erythronate kinase
MGRSSLPELTSLDGQSRRRLVVSVVIVADDLTGANASAALFARRGLKVLSISGRSDFLPGDEFDAVALNTSSRHAPPATAVARVTAAVEPFGAAPLVIKRVDTTLRGNVGAEIESLLIAQRARNRSPVRALVVAAWPRAGRVTRGGTQMIDGVPLQDTSAGREVAALAPSRRVADVVGAGTRMVVEEVGIEVVEAGGEALVTALSRDCDALVCDALTHEHLRAVASAARRVAAEHDVGWLPVDPGPFGVELAAAYGILPSRSLGPLLIIGGSATEATRAQLAEVERTIGARFVDVDVTRFDPVELGRRIRVLLHEAPAEGLVGVRTAASPDDVGPSGAPDGHAIASSLGRAVRTALDGVRPSGIYVTGGDVAEAVLRALEADGIEVLDEAMPLAAAGVLRGGPHSGLPILTKGGLVGGSGAAVVCLDHLLAVARRVQLEAPGHPS